MTAPRIDLDQMARDLGITPEQAADHIREAIDARLLRVTVFDDDQVILEAVMPGEVTR